MKRKRHSSLSKGQTCFDIWQIASLPCILSGVSYKSLLPGQLTHLLFRINQIFIYQNLKISSKVHSTGSSFILVRITFTRSQIPYPETQQVYQCLDFGEKDFHNLVDILHSKRMSIHAPSKIPGLQYLVYERMTPSYPPSWSHSITTGLLIMWRSLYSKAKTSMNITHA